MLIIQFFTEDELVTLWHLAVLAIAAWLKAGNIAFCFLQWHAFQWAKIGLAFCFAFQFCVPIYVIAYVMSGNKTKKIAILKPI